MTFLKPDHSLLALFLEAVRSRDVEPRPKRDYKGLCYCLALRVCAPLVGNIMDAHRTELQ